MWGDVRTESPNRGGGAGAAQERGTPWNAGDAGLEKAKKAGWQLDSCSGCIENSAGATGHAPPRRRGGGHHGGRGAQVWAGARGLVRGLVRAGAGGPAGEPASPLERLAGQDAAKCVCRVRVRARVCVCALYACACHLWPLLHTSRRTYITWARRLRPWEASPSLMRPRSWYPRYPQGLPPHGPLPPRCPERQHARVRVRKTPSPFAEGPIRARHRHTRPFLVHRRRRASNVAQRGSPVSGLAWRRRGAGHLLVVDSTAPPRRRTSWS